MTVHFRYLEISGTEWLDTRDFADGTSDDVIQAAAEKWAGGWRDGLSWWIDGPEKQEPIENAPPVGIK